MKKYLLLPATIFLTLATSATPTCAAANLTSINPQVISNTTIEYLDNGAYIETVLSTDTLPPTTNYALSAATTTQSITKKKTTYYKNSNGTVLWSAYVKATFTYDGSTSKCTSCSHGYTINDKTWSVSSISSSKSGNSATTNVTAKQTAISGVVQTIKRSITIKCSANGSVS